MRSGSRSWWWVLPVSLSLVGCRSPIERDIDNGNEAKLVQTLASPDGQAKLAARGDRWLQRAVQAGQAESVEALLKAGALRDAAGPEGRLLLSQAMTVEDGRAAAQVLRVLVRHGVSPWAPDAQGRTALHEALETGRPGVVKELLALFPDLEGFDARPTRLLARAAQLGDLESVQLLVRAGVPLEEGALLSASLPPDILRPLRGAHLHFLLERASERGDAAELRSLVSGTVPEVWNAMHVGPAHLAVLGNDRRRLATLLKEPESREAVDDRGLGLLHQAALSAEPRTAHALAKAEVDLEARTPSGRTPLMLAAQRGRVDMVRELMGLGAEVNAEDAAGQSALSLAARGGHASTVDALVSGGAFLVRARALEGVAEGPLKQSLEAAHARFLLRWATETGQHAEEVRLRRAGASVAPWMGALDITPYVRALLEEDLPRLQELASAHPEDFARLIHQREGRTLLHWAALGGAEKSAAWLLEKGAWLEAEEPSRGLSQGGTPLGAAVAEGKWGVAALWVARGAVWTQEPVPGTPAERERVLELGRKNAALKEALRDGRLEALPELLQAGARMAAAGEGLVPSALAGRVLEGDALSELTRRELGARGAEAGGRTPLHYAAAAGNVAAVEKLLALGAAVSPRDRTGVTPLGYAARSGHVPTVNRLLAARASPLEPARPGTSALEAALCAPHPEAALLLLSRAGSATVSADCWPRALSQVLARGEERDALALLERWEPAEKDFPLELALEAAGRDRAEVVRWLLDYQGPLMRAHHRALLVRAAEAGARGTVALLLDRAPAGDEQRRLQE
ncbi:MAG: ankyrin repeat domain-containing protein, partial [Cystobacter sp.]